MKELPKVYCKKEKKEVPIWWCLGSYIQGREKCDNLIEMRVKMVENYASVKCGFKEED